MRAARPSEFSTLPEMRFQTLLPLWLAVPLSSAAPALATLAPPTVSNAAASATPAVRANATSARLRQGTTELPSDRALRPLANAIAGYFEEAAEGRPSQKARDEVDDALRALGAKLELDDPLKRSDILGRALFLSRRYDREKVKKGKICDEEFAGDLFSGGALRYAYRLPKGYDARGAGYPLLLVVPDEGEQRALDETLRARWELREMRDDVIVVCLAMPASREHWAKLVVDGRAGGLQHVFTALRIARERFAVDDDRIFLVGDGAAVETVVAAGNHRPQAFAGVIGRSGDVGELGPDNFSNLPTLFLNAGARATEWKERAESLGRSNCALAPGGDLETLWAWVRERRRDTLPTEVHMGPGTYTQNRGHWMYMEPYDSRAKLTARIDREQNRIVVEGHGASQVRIALNDELLNLDQTILVTANGEESQLRAKRRLSTALDSMAEFLGDTGAVYTAEVTIPLPKVR